MKRRLWLAARSVLALGLAALLLLGVGEDRRDDGSVRVSASSAAANLAQTIAAHAAGDWVYADSVPPSRAVSTILAGAARNGAGVTVVVPGIVPGLDVTAPRASTARRRSSIAVRVRGTPGDSLPVVVDDAAGVGDTVVLEIGASGTTAASIAVEPTREGASTWTVRAGGETVTAHSWTRPEKPVRVLVLSGTPSWESRYFIRALESAGAIVDTRQDLGRGRTVATAGTPTPTSRSQLEPYEVVVVIGGVAAPTDEVVRQWVEDEGGGLLVMEPGAGAPDLELWSTAGTRTSLSARDIRWSGPAEIVPLPAVDLTMSAQGLRTSARGGRVAWSAGGGDERNGDEPGEAYVIAGWLGRGRTFVSGLETWPWALEAGVASEHSRYWESVVEWLAGGLRDDRWVSGGPGQPGVAWSGRVEGTVPTAFELIRTPDTTAGRELLQPGRSSDGASYVRFVPTAVGSHTLGDPVGEGVVVTDGNSRGSWQSAALEIGGAGGEIRSRSSGTTSSASARLGASVWSRWLLFLALGGLAVTSWAARRLEGRP